MGWWRIDEGGGIDWDSTGNCGLINADPRFNDTQENHYNGDEPADLMGDAITKVMDHFGVPYESEIKVPEKDIRTLFFEQKFVGFFADKPQGDVLQIISDVWKDLEELYVNTWKRPPYPEEKHGAFGFVVGGYTPEKSNDQT